MCGSNTLARTWSLTKAETIIAIMHTRIREKQSQLRSAALAPWVPVLPLTKTETGSYWGEVNSLRTPAPGPQALDLFSNKTTVHSLGGALAHTKLRI